MGGIREKLSIELNITSHELTPPRRWGFALGGDRLRRTWSLLK